MASLMRFLGAFNSGRTAMLAMAVCLAVVGAAYEWIRFPLSAPVRGISVGYASSGSFTSEGAGLVSQGLIFLLIVLMATAAEGLGKPRLRKVLAGLAITALFYQVVYLALIDGRWLETYTAQAASFRRLDGFLARYFTPNSGMDTRFLYVEEFEYLVPDRLLFVWEATGHGWLLALAGACLLAAAPDERRAAPAFPGAAVIAAAGTLLLLSFFGAPAVRADYLHHLGDRYLAQGDYPRALDAFAEAKSADPVLARSVIFMVKVSKTHYALKGSQEPYAWLYMADLDMRGQEYDRAATRFSILAAAPIGDSTFREAYLEAARKAEREAYILRGLRKYEGGDKNQAGRDFARALAVAVAADPKPADATFMAARIDMDLARYDSCVQRADALLAGGGISRRSTQAELHSTAGECYARMRDYVRAREAYFKSFNLDNRSNYRAYQGLSGT